MILFPLFFVLMFQYFAWKLIKSQQSFQEEILSWCFPCKNIFVEFFFFFVYWTFADNPHEHERVIIKTSFWASEANGIVLHFEYVLSTLWEVSSPSTLGNNPMPCFCISPWICLKTSNIRSWHSFTTTFNSSNVNFLNEINTLNVNLLTDNMLWWKRWMNTVCMI